MQIEISNENGCAQVKVINPSTSAVVNTAVVEAGQKVTIAATNAHEVSDIEVGEVCPINDETETASETGDESGSEDEGGTDASAVPQPGAGDGSADE